MRRPPPEWRAPRRWSWKWHRIADCRPALQKSRRSPPRCHQLANRRSMAVRSCWMMWANVWIGSSAMSSRRALPARCQPSRSAPPSCWMLAAVEWRARALRVAMPTSTLQSTNGANSDTLLSTDYFIESSIIRLLPLRILWRVRIGPRNGNTHDALRILST